MSGGAGSEEADGGSRPSAQAAEQKPSEVPGQPDDRWALDEHGVWRQRRRVTEGRPPRQGPKRRVGAITVAGGVGLSAVLVIGGVLISNEGTAPGFHPTATKPALAARQTAEAFLAAWEKGHVRKAASYTDHPDAAAAALTSYRDGLNLHALHLTVHGATAHGKVAYSAAATVGLAANPSVTATWSYGSDLVAYAKNGGWWVRWTPALVAPNLTAGEKVVTVPVAPAAAEVVDAAGGNLQDLNDPGLDNIAAALTKSASDGTPGIEVAFVGPGGASVAGTADADLIRQPVAPGAKTTIDPNVEAAAKSAVQGHPDSSMVVIQPTTGDILAVANNDGANDFALTARVAPGSTNKIITSTALFTTGLVSSPSQPVECPPQVDANGEVINNAGGESEPPDTPFLTDFAASCNNAFDRWYASLGPQTLAQTAQKYYGLNQPWNIGVGSGVPYYTIPGTASNGELALELFGQGELETAPLAMASVAATVDTGSFKQPIVVPGQAQVSATPLPGNVHQYLWQMMRAVTQSGGTAAGVFDGVGSAVYAKTGTADVSGQQQPNSWMVAFDPTLNVAIGCLVLNAGYGASVAGPEAATVLQLLTQPGG
jgi:Penicillin binding protein transpeptidase domain/NTF2-like N-terminal transpeptidase domain